MSHGGVGLKIEIKCDLTLSTPTIQISTLLCISNASTWLGWWLIKLRVNTKESNIYIYIYILSLYNCALASNAVSLPTPCPFPLYGIKATLFWPVIVLLCSLSLRLCLPETLVLSCCVPFLPSLAPP